MENSLASEMLQHIKNPLIRQRYANILSGQADKLVHCDSKTCKGRVIAHITNNGQVVETDPVVGPEGAYISGLEGSRERLDGFMGFRCYCGNNSILSEHEEGIITAAPPSQADLNTILDKIKKKPSEYKEKDRVIKIDGFSIEGVS